MRKPIDILSLVPYASGQHSVFGGSPMEEMEVFHFEDDRQNFEDYGLTNGGRYWYASDLMQMLGYESLNSFNKAINKAISACVAINIPIQENFIQTKRVVDNRPIADWKLTRFACYLTARTQMPASRR